MNLLHSNQKTRVGLVQINNSFSGQNYLPYSLGMLQAYAQKHVANVNQYQFLNPIYARENIATIARNLEGSSIVFFSTYVWNFRISLAIAKTLKQINSKTLIVFGGPQVPDRIEGFLEKYNFIDLVCHGEGEQVFASILNQGINRLYEKDFEGIPSISYLNCEGIRISHPRASRLKDLNQIPSPFLEGVFESLIAANPQKRWIGTWETNRGCPFSCTFCDWGSATQSRLFQFDMERIYREAEWFAQKKIEHIFCADANFGILSRDYDIAAYLAEVRKKYGYPTGINFQNTKNATERAYKIQKLLSDVGLNKGVTLSLQSIDPVTLKNIRRDNISTDFYQELQRRFTRDRVETYTDMILGLPGETYKSFCQGIATLIENGQHNRIQFNNLSILPNAPMADPQYIETHGIETVQTKIINMHGVIENFDEEADEMQELVVATKTCPREDWVKMRASGWMVNFMYFNKILQIPLLLLHKNFDIRMQELLGLFTDGSLKNYPILGEIRQFFYEKAKDIQQGGTEYCPSKEWLNIYWPADEYILIQLCVGDKLVAFYKEAEAILNGFLQENFTNIPKDFLKESLFLNKSLLKLPFQTEDLKLKLFYNIWEAYQAAKASEMIVIEEQKSFYHIDRTTHRWNDWKSWFREVIWWGNKKGAYLYTNTTVEPQLAGHY
ncbi:MAG: hypothetical protein A2W61_03010 [Deltaproteobacteria bacterium RIFCSPLOWO2_01_44_7]|nr:MAG: hypothetical protein A2712_02490 [Deltaproteobacteria bacterium RIFCSPHIGHO2_01_FULL_43_49]OGQ16064.1 MAG: hypothetical protein A3D22_00460 [Deltaproteobacteria bacterium RIFCSPHIGHO2_02_FULL_44_53]OGQ29025.1 MAG: hypothetical protein A3D98_04245 [Deltaproteobacteria bacterium RIFCSPHIGHO2_12_FULL_44_21]OGQ32581.1 MAG: hypothetical protein A2979_08390 [Deltaproteobacteria bacterium RIFCSPLOWO2_01_FULL_45_74]OGQ38323.1 MAG: hypothetical protein A2W61_03010 [Deltaproteobacteria bacterium 